MIIHSGKKDLVIRCVLTSDTIKYYVECCTRPSQIGSHQVTYGAVLKDDTHMKSMSRCIYTSFTIVHNHNAPQEAVDCHTHSMRYDGAKAFLAAIPQLS